MDGMLQDAGCKVQHAIRPASHIVAFMRSLGHVA